MNDVVKDLWGLANYDGLQIRCSHCGNPNCYSDQTYCPNCGKLLHNVCCGDDDCDAKGLDHGCDECFCPSCGAETAFYRQGYIEPIDYWSQEDDAENLDEPPN